MFLAVGMRSVEVGEAEGRAAFKDYSKTREGSPHPKASPRHGEPPVPLSRRPQSLTSTTR